jgi:hypothetical protein
VIFGAHESMSGKARKSWREKLADSKGLPKVGRIEGKLSARWGTGTMVMPAPLEVDQLIRRVPAGKLATINDLRRALARKHKVSIACPITTGIFSWIAAHAAEEAAQAGARLRTPYWRILKAKGELNPKYPGGIPGLVRKLRAEGHRLTKRGQRTFVANFEESLVKWK